MRKELWQWISEYKEKTGDDFYFLNGFTTWYLPDRGFCQWAPLDDLKAIIVWNLCHDGRFWRDALECVAMQFGYDRIMTTCIIPIKPYIRYWGWEIMQEFDDGIAPRYICRDKCGREVVCTPKNQNGDGTINYIVTNELKRQYRPWKSKDERET